LKIIVAFIFGLIGGGLLIHSAHIWSKKQEQQRKHQVWQEAIPATVTNYFFATRAVPIPPDLDFSTNSWRQLNYWLAFARAYTAIDTNVPILLWSERPPRLVTPGFRPEDPNWIGYVDGFAASRLANDAAAMSQRGLSFPDLVSWVKTNFQFDTFGPQRGEALLEASK